jgi:hypothetical protein
MLVIRDQDTFRAMVTLAMENACFEPVGGSTSSEGYLGPLLAYLEDLGGTDEFKFAARLVLSSSTEPLSLTFCQEAREPDGDWVKQLEGQLVFEAMPRPRFRLRFNPMASALSAF